MSEPTEELERTAEERLAKARAAENELLEQLQFRGIDRLWGVVKDGLHAERFWTSRTGKRVAESLLAEVVDAQLEWLHSPDPTSKEAIEMHRRAQAAHLALAVLDRIVGAGEEATQELEEIQRDIDG